MPKPAIQVITAASLGAFIGSVIALSLPSYWWLVGLVIGGLTGYLTYDFKSVLAAIPIAWQQTRAALHRIKNWHPDPRTVAFMKGELWIHLAAMIIMTINACGLLAITILLPEILFYGKPIHYAGARDVFLVTVMFAYFFTFIAIFVRPDEIPPLRISSFICRHLNPFKVFIFWPAFGLSYTVRILALTLYVLVCAAWIVAIATPMLSKNLFLLIHSDLRLLCGTGAAIGTVTGYATGNPMIGLGAGALVGYLAFEIISKRLLKLAAAPRSH